MDRVRLVLDGSDNNGEIMTRAEAEERIAALLDCHVADLVTELLVDGSGYSYYASEEARAADDGSVGPAPRIDDLEDAEMETYTIGDWILAGWSMDELVAKARKEGWTARQVMDWCIDHADDEAQREEVRSLPGDDELLEGIEDAIRALNDAEVSR